MNLHHCFSSLGCPDFTVEQTLALAGRHGLKAVELRSLGGTIELPTYFAGKYASPAALAEVVRKSGVRVVSLDSSMHLVGATDAEREQLTAFVPWAEALGVKRLRVFDGGKKGDDAELTEAVETLRWWRELRRQGGWQVDLMVETHDLLFSGAAIERLLTRAAGTAILWDTHHTWKKGGEDPRVTWATIRGNAVHLHVKDSVSVPSGKHPYSYVLPGEGEFPMAPLVAALRADGFTGPVSLEWEKMWHPHLAPLDDALTAAAKHQWW